MSIGHLQYPDLEFDVEAYVDTGFDGGLIVPAGLIPDRVRMIGETICTLADGSTLQARSYAGFVSIGSLSPVDTIIMTFAGRSLLGLDVTSRYRLSFLYGPQVILEP